MTTNIPTGQGGNISSAGTGSNAFSVTTTGLTPVQIAAQPETNYSQSVAKWLGTGAGVLIAWAISHGLNAQFGAATLGLATAISYPLADQIVDHVVKYLNK